ncbi:hypothetical protein HDV06_000848 [Boothiomyces sp. JEL0866]|nr:hypothetical protein HDV06_000839 [Boothiomyces sp. JEL0866]KAJ3318080.1 hypothetical protein HDV06_000848 [Boothiomyces sp. JEL0866]
MILTVNRLVRRQTADELPALENLSRLPYEREFQRLLNMKALPKTFPYVQQIMRLNNRDSWTNGTIKQINLDDFKLDLLPSPPENQTIIKYFRESNKSHHLDEKYGQFGKFNLMESMKTIFAVFSQFCSDNDIDYWIAHGSLIGWYWNQKVLPWDDDIDIQTSLKGLLQLQQFNQTIIAGRYLINVNPYMIYRDHQGNNVIDARFIDTQTGIFLDITGLALMEDGKLKCKSPHSYEPTFMFPLHLTLFENIWTWRNHKVIPILKTEYSVRSMLSKYFRGNYWNESIEEWVRGKKLEKPNYRHMRNKYRH